MSIDQKMEIVLWIWKVIWLGFGVAIGVYFGNKYGRK